MSNITILFFQIREPEMATHELELVVENSGLRADQIVSCNCALGERVDLETIGTYDGVIIGGAGGYSVLDDEWFVSYLEDVSRYCKEHTIPFLGLCFGFQIAIQAFGGSIIRDPKSQETGSYMMHRSAASDSDPIVGSLPRDFLAACGRQDRAARLPDGMVGYVRSDLCAVHYATFPGLPLYLIQFHPELWKRADNLRRLAFYSEKYRLSGEERTAQEAQYHDAPETRHMIRNFVVSLADG